MVIVLPNLDNVKVENGVGMGRIRELADSNLQNLGQVACLLASADAPGKRMQRYDDILVNVGSGDGRSNHCNLFHQ